MTTRSAKTATAASANTATNNNKFSSPNVTMKPNPRINDAPERLEDAATSPPPMVMGRQVRFATNVVATPVLASTRKNSAQVSNYQTTESLDNLIGQMQGMAIQDRQDEEKVRQRVKNNITNEQQSCSTFSASQCCPVWKTGCLSISRPHEVVQ
jgi:hypothetical protein